MKHIKEIRDVLRFHESISNEAKLGDDHYRLDRSNTAQYFSLNPKLRTRIESYFHELKKANEIVTHVDICGRTSARSLGADKSICFSLKTSDIKKSFSCKSQEFYDGDIFSSKEFSKFLRYISHYKPALVTFEPVAGLQSYGPMQGKDISLYTEITYEQLSKRLCSVINVVRPGGFIYIERPFQFDPKHFVEAFKRVPIKEFTLSLAVKKIARRMKCKVTILSEIGGPYFLFQKRA